MASRRQKQMDRKYSSYRKFTATEDVNYSNHSSRSSFRSESLTSRSDGRTRSTSTEIIAGSDTRSYPVYIAIQDYQPDNSDLESIPLEQGQIVEVLDKKNAARWLVRTKARPPRSGWVPGSYFETPTEYYKQRRRTREVNGKDANMTEEQLAVLKRDQVYHDLLRSEEEFVSELRSCVDDYIKVMDDPGVPEEVRAQKDKLALNVHELYNFHANVMLKGLNYYSDDPGKVGQTFVRLEKDFESYIQFYRDYSNTLDLLEKQPYKGFFQNLSDKVEAGARTYADHLRNIADRMTQYQNYFKEFVKYSSRANHNTKSMQKALELCQAIPQRVQDLDFTKNIKQYPGDTSKLGRIIRHDMFQVWEGEDSSPKDRYVFLFKNKVMITDKVETSTATNYNHYATIRLDKYSVRSHPADEDTILLQPNEPGLPSFRAKPKDLGTAEYVRQAWLRDMAEEQEIYAAERENTITETTTSAPLGGAASDFEMQLSDVRSEFSEYSSSRKSSLYPGPDEGGPPRKKVKSPPVISPTGSSTSLYSGGSSSIDWTTTGTTLEMQGTRVTRTQYGFRTLQESSAKMCLKVTGYPLPEITWFKDDVQLKEGERHTFYSDEDGFFALTIDPVKEEDTGRYTCTATNEFGQASTSAFFRVIKVEKEAAPPKFVTQLRDQEAKEGDVISVECEVEGWPEPELLWLVDDQPLRPSHDFKLQYDGQRAKLEIRDAQPDDTGIYCVKIQNELGVAESKCELIVQPDPDKNHVAPEFQMNIDDVECNEGDEVRFKAVYTGDPNPEITWYVNGVPLTESEKVRFISEDGICILTIKDVTRHFDGIVTCQAKNRLGQAACDGKLRVRVPPAPPAFLRPLDDKSVVEKSIAVFEVEVTGFPDPTLKFILKGKELQNGVDGVEIISQDGYYKVIINDANIEKHDGEMIARATNEHGTAESRARLIVEQQEEESRSAPTFIKDIEDQTVKFGEQAVFETTVRGSPNPDVTWYINGLKMDSNSPGVKIEKEGHDHKMTIDSARYAGTIACVAQNVVGKYETKARLIVLPQAKPKAPPRFTELLSDRTETEEKTVIFEVRVEGEPKPEVRWYINGEDVTNSSRVEIREFDGSIKLELKGLKLSDAGEIKAVATNSEGTAETKARLNVNRKPFPPKFERTPKSVTVEKGAEATFEAKADGQPAPTYQWSVNGRKVRDGMEGIRVSQAADGASILTIDTSVHGDSATIAVVAENSLGADESGARLVVEPKKSIQIIDQQKTAAEEQKTIVEKTEQSVTMKTEGTIEVSKIEIGGGGVVQETVTETREFTRMVETSGGAAPTEEILVSTAQTTSISETQSSEGTSTTTATTIIDLGSKSEKTEEIKETTTVITDQQVKKEKSPEKKKSPPKDTTITTTQLEQKEEKISETVTTTTSEQKEKGPEKKKKSVSPPKSPTKKEPEVQKIEEKPKSPTKKEPSPQKVEEKPTSPTKKEPSPKKEEVPAEQLGEKKKSKSPEKKGVSPPKSPTKKGAEEPQPVSTTEVVEPVKGVDETKKEPSPVKQAVPEEVKPEPIEQKKEKSPEKKKKSVSPPKSPVKKEAEPQKAEEKPASPTKKEPSPQKVEERPTSPKGKEKSKSKSPPAAKDQAEPEKPAEKPKSPTKKSPSPQKEPEKPKVPPPRITRDLKSQTVNKPDLAHFEVVVENATSIQWFLDGKEITTAQGVTTSKDNQFEFRASLDSTYFSTGTVSIKASNEAGTVETKCDLKVLEQIRETNKPEFTDKLRDMEVTKGERVQMDVIALNSPKFRWFLNGQPLEDGKNGVHITQDGNKSTLVIDRAEDSHTGKVTVEAYNEIGASESSGKLTVNPPATAPQITDGPYSLTISEKETVEFKCTITGFPEPTVKWYLNDQVLEQSSTITTTKVQQQYSLKISEIKSTQSGTIKVTAQNSAGQDSKSADLKVNPSFSKPSFKSNLQDKNVNEGEPIRYDVALEGPSTGTEVTWYLNGKPLTNGDGVQVVDHGDGTYHVTIAEAKPDMSGTITVKAKNPAGECESSAKINVSGGQKKPEFTKSPQDHETVVDESIKFSAVVTGVPTPQVSWYLNDKKLEHQEGEIKVKHEPESGKTSIRIYKPKKEQTGEVKVVAENVLGKAEAKAKLKVDFKKEVPRFTTNMDDRQVNEGDTVKYTTKVEGYPEPTVEWLLNGEPVAKQPNIKTTDRDGEYTIEINEITPDQAGQLTCSATNSVGDKKQNVTLAVKRTGDAPTFARQLEDRLTTENDVTVMEAKLNIVKPKPTVKWLKDGKELHSDDHIKLVEQEDGTLQLRISQTKVEDKGRITIKAENYFGTAESSASLGVTKGRPMNKPAFQSDIAPITLTEGDTLDTKLLITGDPTPFVKWYINGQLVCETEDTEITNANGVYNLKIHGVTSDMTGKIKCTAYNKAGEVTTEGPLKVIAPIPVEFETSLCDATCREGDTLKLKAVLLGEPTPVVSWYVNGKKLQESQNIKIHQEKGTYTVTIKDITCDYSGKVVCEAVNEYGTATSEATLLVLPRGEPPDFIEWLSNVRARTGSKVVHKVVFTGDPKPTLSWYINNKEVFNGPEYTIVTDDKTSTLTVNSFNPDKHVGEIICKAENEAGEVSCTANMATYTSDMFSESESDVQAEDFVDDLEEESRDELRRTPTPVQAPKFITKIKDVKAKKGGEAIFECVVPDTKGVVCKWLKDGKEIELIARIRVQTRTIEGHTTQELIIDDVKPEDAGKYTCVVENATGKDVCEANLTVLEDVVKTPSKAPEFTLELKDKTVKVTDKVIFECKVDGKPSPNVIWFHDNQVVESRSEKVTIERTEGVERLTIKSVETTDQGTYKCVAENEAGSTKTEAKLIVEAQPPSFTKYLEDTSLVIGHQLVLSCSVKGVPQPHVEFFQHSVTRTEERIKLTSSNRISIEHDASNTHWRMVINEIRKEEFTQYSAVATNSAGSSTSSAKVTQKDAQKDAQKDTTQTITQQETQQATQQEITQKEPEKTEPKEAPKEEAPKEAKEEKKPSQTPLTFEQGLKSKSVREKDEIEMQVRVTGTEPNVDWLKDGQPIQPDANHEFRKDTATGTFTLIVKQAAISDAGRYTAKASNPLGIVESSAEAEVHKLIERPVFTKELVKTEVKMNAMATMSCTVKGDEPIKIEWLKDNKPLNIDGSHIAVKAEAGTHTVTITGAKFEDSGKIIVRASNQGGQAETSANFTVYKSLSAPYFSEKLQPLEVNERESASFHVQVRGSPEPDIHWFKDGKPIEPDNEHVIIKREPDGKHCLVINNAKSSDVGKYSCTAVNDAGEAKTDAIFSVLHGMTPPEFVEKMQPIEVKEKESGSFSVRVRGSPEPIVKWYKDKEAVKIDGVHVIEKEEKDGKFTLTIKDARKSDIGMYSCKAMNSAGQVTIEANFAVLYDSVPPEFTEKLRPIEVNEHESATLKCTVVGHPDPTIQWLKNDQPVQIDGVHLITSDDGAGHISLTIKDAREEDRGIFSCYAVNPAGEAKTSASFGIIEEIEAPMFTEGLRKMDVEEGKPAELKVTVIGKPEPQVTWMKDGQPVNIDNSHIVTRKDEQGHHTLIIKDVAQRDLGSYTCKAVNKAGHDETIGEIRIPKYGFEKAKSEEVQPFFIEELHETTAVIGENVVLTCRVNKESHPEIKFYKDGKELVPDQRMQIDRLDDGRIIFTIQNARKEDIGSYKCEAVNRAGKADTRAELQLKYATTAQETVADEGGMLEELAQEAPIQPESAKATDTSGRGPPEFIELLRSVNVSEKQTAVLRCKVKGEPTPKITWKKDGKVVEMSARIRSEQKSDGTLTLTIDNATSQDAGEYRCEAENELGSAWTEGPIIFMAEGAVRPDEGAPDFVQPIKPVVVTVGETAVLEGKVAGKPRPTVKWYKNGKLLTPDDRVKIEDLPDGTQRLTIKDAKLDDGDEYRCSASNEHGDVWCDVTLTVKEPQQTAPEFTKKLQPQSVKQGDKALLECQVTGSPQPEVTWFKDGNEVKPTEIVKIQSDSDGTQKLIIDKAKAEDQGNYRVEAKNPAGRDSSEAPLTVTSGEPTLKIKRGLNDMTIEQGTRILLSVEVEGKPKTVKWYKGSEQITSSSTTKIEKISDEEYKLEIERSELSDSGSYRVVLSNETATVESSSTVVVTTKAEKVHLPSFKKGLADKIVPKGTPISLEVEVEGKPKQVKWYKGGEPLKDAKTEDLGDGKFRLTIPDFKDTDAGEYSVVATNDAGEVESKAKLTLKDEGDKDKGDGKDKGKPEIVSGLVPTTVKKGDTATFTVKVKGPVKGVKWYKNGKEIPDAKTKDLGDGTYQLEIPNAQKDDAANYKVVLSNDAGDADSSAELTVKLPGLELLKGLEDTAVPKGEPAKLEIKTNQPPKSVKWYKNGKEIGPDDKAKPVKVDDNSYRLDIPDTDENDDADYKVVLTGPEDEPCDSSCKLTVKLPPKDKGEKPGFAKGLEDQIVPIGSPVKLAIQTTGSPKSVKWYKNGKELPGAAASQIKIDKIDDNNYVLEIPSSAVDDTGDYKVVIANDAGQAESSGKLTVEPKLTFLKPLKDQEVVEGENAEFTVETNAKPRSVKWYKNGQEIKPDDHFAISGDNTKYSLVIKKATLSDAAEYKVVLSNSAGDADSSAKLTVKKAKAPVCKILKGLQDQAVAKGAALVFEVKIEGEPTTIRWLKDGKPLEAGANIKIDKIDDQTYRLTIPKADLSDAGEYTFEAANDGGKATSDAKGEVDEKPEIVKGLEDTEIPVGDDDVLKVEVSQPVRTVKWYKNGQEIKPSSHFEPKKLGPKKYELAIHKAELDDGATYKVVLGNAAGECDSSCALTVKKPDILKLLQGLKDVDVNEGEPFALKVKVEGKPKSVKWYRNGQELQPCEGMKQEANPEAGEYSLVVPSAWKEDGGAYRVDLANDKGEVTSGSVVHVKPTKPKVQGVGANFLSPLQDQEVEEGEILTLTAKVGGEPMPEIKWEKDGVDLKKDDRITIRLGADGTATLRIRDVKKSDFGQYRITATNETGSATSACQVTVKEKEEPPSKPKFIIPLKATSAMLGEKAEFNVKVRGMPKPSLEWFHNGKPISFADGRITVEDMRDGNWCLTIKDVREEDFGTLKCVAKNENGSDECQCEFDQATQRPDRQIGDEKYPPRFNVPLWDRRIPVNDPMFIECHVDARPTAEIEWFKDGVKLQPSSNLEIRNSVDGACRIRIPNFREEDCGVYKCVATNPLGSADTLATYQVEVKEEVPEEHVNEYAPKFNPGLEDRNVNSGQPIHLSCRVDAIPKASITWYKDGLPLRSDGRITIEYNDDGTCTLSIPEAKGNDEGAYRCVASNIHGSTNTACLVNVKVPKQEIIKEGEEPFFTKGLVDAWVDRGEEFTLRCAVKGDPFPEIKWYRNGQLVRNTPRTIIENTPDGQCALTIKDCTMSDEGIYRCEAENKHGKAKTQCTAHVQMAIGGGEKPKLPEGEAPRFIIPLSDTTVVAGATVDLECKVTGIPMPQVKWAKDGAPIWEDARYEWDINEEKGTYHLRIRNASLQDEGTYRVTAVNDNGSANTKSFVKLDDGMMAKRPEDKGHAPRFTIKLGDARATEGQPLKLECKIDAVPLPEVTWYKDGAVVTPSDRIQITLDPDGTARLLIPSCTMDDDGLYRITARNPHGSAQDKGNATVKRAPKDTRGPSADRDIFDANKAPKLIEPLENVKVPEKQSFTLRCKFSGDPKPTIKWFKDGERVFPYGRLQLNEYPDGVCELVVSSAARTDQGGYRCIAENSQGSARTTCDVTVVRDDKKDRAPRDLQAAIQAGKAPGFTIPLTIKKAKPGETVTFECLPYGTPFPNIKWLKDGIELMPSDKYKIEALEDGTQKLHVSDITFVSEGYFRCVATNEHGTASTKAELVVEGDRSAPKITDEGLGGEPEESKPRIRRGLYNMSVHQGNIVEMIVCATGLPTPTVKWFKDGEEIHSDGAEGKRTIFTDERGIHHLVIINAGPEDEGEYSLEATNKLGSARTEGSLNIIRPRAIGDMDDRGGMPFPPGFVRQLKNKHVFNHMPTIFDCLVVGHPPPEVEWFHNGKKITAGGRIKIQSCGGGSHALLITDTTLEDAGEYVAIATNCHGKASSSAILDVTVPFLDNIKFTGEIDVTPYLTEEYGFKKLNYASFPTPPDKGPFIKEVTGHYLTLSWIPTKRAPPRYPQVTYVIEIRELPEKEWTLLDYNIPEPVCKVRNLELGKSYQFRVRAENIYGISDPSPASPPSRLMAPPQPVFDKRTKKIIPLLDPYAEKELEMRHAEQYACAPWFAPGVVEKRYCAENDTITIILNVQGYPDPDIKWKFRGWDIDTSSPTSKCKVYTYGGTETTLTITGFGKDNVGQYQCIATNEYGEAQQNIMIDVATRPTFIQPLMNKTFKTNQPVKLDVRVEGQPFPELKWMKDWKPIVESSRVKFVQDGPYLCSMIINDPMWRDSGAYSVCAINEAGQATTSATINVDDDIDMDTPRRRVGIDQRKVREIYEIEEEDEKRAGSGAPFRVRERKSERTFLAQLKPYDDALKRTVAIHNSLDHRGVEQYHQVVRDGQLALIVYENADTTLDGLSILEHPGVEVAEPEGMDREKMVRVFMRQLLLALKHMHDLKIAHLDLRPEVILLQDTRLKLADFGQARRLLRGIITGEIKGSPEFISPEVVRHLPLTLATDMFSVGTLAYVLLTGISPFLGDNDNETLANVDHVKYDQIPLDTFSWDAKDFISKLLLEIPINRLKVDEALDHPWLNNDEIKDAPLSADSLREFKYRYKWLERRVFVQQTPSEQIIEAILGPPTLVAQKEAERKAKLAAEAARPVESYDYLRVKPRPPPEIEEVPKKRREHQPYVNEFGELIDPSAFDPYAIPHDSGFADDYPSYERRIPQPSQPTPRQRDSRSRGSEPRDERGHRRPIVDQYGRPLHPEEMLAKHPYDVQGRPIGMDDQQYMVDKYGRPVLPEDVRRAQQHGPVPVDRYGRPIQDVSDQGGHHEKRKLIPQDKGETPSKTKREPPREPQPKEEQDLIKVPLRMIRGERREIEEEIANRILSDISEEGSVAGSLGSLDDFDMPTITRKVPEKQPHSRSSTPKAESDASTPTLSPDDSTVREGVFFPKEPKEGKAKEPQIKREPDGRKGIKIPGSEIVFYPDTALAGLPEKDKEVLERAENDPNIPVGAPLFLEGLHGDGLIIDTAYTQVPSGPSSKSPRRSKAGTKSKVILSPSKEHSMEVLIATKRGKPSFLAPDEEVPELDDEDAKMDERKKQAKKSRHDGKDDFKDESDRLEKDKNRRTVDLDDLDKYRPKSFYKDDLEFERPDYDIDDSPWDSHYQIGPDTYLMATRGPAFNSRVRDYRRTLFGDGAPLVKQGFLGVRNKDVTVRERRRFTDILRESQQNLAPKSQNEHVSSIERAPSATAIERIKADIDKVAPSATKKNDDGTYAPIFISRLRDVYLNKSRAAVFECSVSGSPTPKITWTFQGKILENNPKYAIEQNNNIARLTINNPAAFDLGEYVCNASNEYGTDKTTSRLISGEAPDRPGRPEAELASDTELFITWESPEHVTYLEGISYRLEYRLAGPDDHGAPWVAISDNIDDEAVVVKHLQPLGIYQFRVTARNGFGLGLPSLTSRIVQTHGKGTPKLQIGTLRGEFRLNVVSIPHKAMEGISEESEEESVRTHLDEATSSDLSLNNGDPKQRFQIENLMFKGRFSVIRQAIDSSTEAGSHCISKIRHPADNKEIMREYETLRDSQHENVQVLIAAHSFNNYLYLFCERLYEDVFSRFVFNDYYNEEQIALTVRQMASALHFLHFRGIVHMDVNPHNVMFQSKRSWIVKLVDFGSAQLLKDAVKPEEFDLKWGAPEMHIKDTPVTVQSDMWGLGVVTFCLLAGFHPFTSEYDQEKEIKDNVLNVKCDPNLIPVNASQEALSFVTWSLKKSPLRRMRTDEALSHKFLSTDPSMVRRRENIKYAASRLRKLAALTRQVQAGRPLSNELENNFGAKELK